MSRYPSIVDIPTTQDTTWLSLVALTGAKDPKTSAHLQRTMEYVRLLLSVLSYHADFKKQLPHNVMVDIVNSSALHDIGKVAIPDKILMKPGRLTDTEFEKIKQHPIIGDEILNKILQGLPDDVENASATRAFLSHARDIAYCHHERWDGTGYPNGLSGENIPLSARVMAIADVYDALTTKRTYKPELSRYVVEDIILNKNLGHFDPRILDVFVIYRDKFWLLKQHLESSSRVV